MSLCGSESETDHRPWPAPSRAWGVRMVWHDLLFMHWPLEDAQIRSLIPDGLEIDHFDGKAWIGVVPFRMSGVRPRVLPPFLSAAFPEINVRTYVRRGNRTGVWFFSLDADSRRAVWAARRFFHLPYELATMSATCQGGRIDFHCQRINGRAGISLQYEPLGPPRRSRVGSLEHWLTERYCLFSVGRTGEIFRGDIHHAPWPLQPARAETLNNTMAAPLDISLPHSNPLLHFAKRLDVVAWSLDRAP